MHNDIAGGPTPAPSSASTSASQPAVLPADPAIRAALASGGTIDITTIGRQSGLPRRIEIVFHNFGGRIYISGMPRADRRRSWLANLESQPRFTFHLKGTARADLPARARIVTDPAERRAIVARIVASAWPNQDVEAMVAHAPLIEVVFESAGG